jgi:hypothetical protein
MRNLALFSGILALAAASACSDDSSSGGSAGSVSTAGRAGSGGRGGSGGSSAGSAGRGGSSNEGQGGRQLNTGGSSGSGNSAGGRGGNGGSGGAAGAPSVLDAGVVGDAGVSAAMSFFVTSRGLPNGGNLGGLTGADAFCDELATAVSPVLGAKTWRAYLSTTTVNARDRIGTGPWVNAAGVVIANNVTQLHDQGAGGTLDQTWPNNDPTIALDETGEQVSLAPQQHDILTGSQLDGTLAAGLACGDWTATTGFVQVGHANRAGGGAVANSWNAAHGNVTGCAPLGGTAPTVQNGGGRGSFYCFAID